MIAIGTSPCIAWLSDGHVKATKEAMTWLEDKGLPKFFMDHGDDIAREATLPDLWSERMMPELRDGERANHYIDLELLQDRPLPPTRHQFIALCAEMKLNPVDAGYLPYAVTEQTQKLAMTMAEHRKWPDDKAIQQRILSEAAHLAHYAQDLAQPLHVTVHHDGWEQPGSGIHFRMDSLFQRMTVRAGEPNASAWDKLDVAAVMQCVNSSHALVKRVYELQVDLPPREGDWMPNAAIQKLADDRFRAAVKQTADLILTAWKMSEKIKLPAWLPAPPGDQVR
ncbi:MAG: hypothetical protein IT440_03005 [Phycisphaeraceae bacterium]|nr:hypothetical protein [Phycisphaeraceae bacterium]